jgi:hypothetical protein
LLRSPQFHLFLFLLPFLRICHIQSSSISLLCALALTSMFIYTRNSLFLSFPQRWHQEHIFWTIGSAVWDLLIRQITSWAKPTFLPKR